MKLSKPVLLSLFCICFFCTEIFAQNFENIKSYKVNFALAKHDNERLIALRSFSANNQKYLLLVNPETLDTKVDLASNYSTRGLQYSNVFAIFKNTAYIKSIEAAAARDLQLQNAGIDHAIPKEKGITLTIDLCPSHKALDRIIFQSVFDEFKKTEQPAPLAISVSGKWMLKHQDDLNWLKSLVKNKELDITWVNHTYNHEVNKLPLAENFQIGRAHV